VKSLHGSFFLWLANRMPDLYVLKVVKAALLRAAGVHVGLRDFYFLSPVHIDDPRRVSIGSGVFLNRNCIFEGRGRIELAENVHVGPNVVFATTNHRLGGMDESVRDIVIGPNVWIGANVTLVPGVVVGPNVVVGAGAVVTKNFENCTVAGVPARILNDEDG